MEQQIRKKYVKNKTKLNENSNENELEKINDKVTRKIKIISEKHANKIT